MSDELEAIIKHLVGAKLSQEEIQSLISAIQLGNLTLATGERSTALGGNASDAVFVNGDHNNVTIIGKDKLESRQISSQIYTNNGDNSATTHYVESICKTQRVEALNFGDTNANPINVLIGLMSVPKIYSAVVSFRTDFEAACEQIKLLEFYKDLHDLLHTLEFQCYSSIVREVRRFPRDPTGLETIKNSLLIFEQIVKDVNMLTTELKLSISDILWVKDLEHAEGSLKQAYEHLEIQSLKFSISLINQTLNNIPSQINIKLNSAARSLRVDALIEGMTYILNNLNNSNLDSEKIRFFQNFVSALNKVYVNLSKSVQKHDEWQAIDLRLRQIEITIEKDFSALESSWSYLKDMSKLQFNNCEEDWAMGLKQDCENLESVILARDKAAIKPLLRSYRRRVGLCFYRVDKDLKQLCNTLRTIGEPLAIMLGMIV